MRAEEAGAFECLLVSGEPARLLEGSFSNVLMWDGACLVSAPARSRLVGVTETVVVQAARTLGMRHGGAPDVARRTVGRLKRGGCCSPAVCLGVCPCAAVDGRRDGAPPAAIADTLRRGTARAGERLKGGVGERSSAWILSIASMSIIVGPGRPASSPRSSCARRSSLSILLIEKGCDISERAAALPARPATAPIATRVTSPAGGVGAGAFSDGKLTLSPEVGGWLGEYLDPPELQKAITEVDLLWREFGAPETLYGTDPERVDSWRTKALTHRLKLIDSSHPPHGHRAVRRGAGGHAPGTRRPCAGAHRHVCGSVDRRVSRCARGRGRECACGGAADAPRPAAGSRVW